MGVFVNTTVVNPVLDWITGVDDPPATGTRYLTVYNGDPQGAGTEVINTLNGSANRIDMTTAMAAASGGVALNDTLITIVSAAVAGATVNFAAVFDAITGGNLLASAAVTSKTLAIGDGLRVAIGSLSFTIT